MSAKVMGRVAMQTMFHSGRRMRGCVMVRADGVEVSGPDKLWITILGMGLARTDLICCSIVDAVGYG